MTEHHLLLERESERERERERCKKEGPSSVCVTHQFLEEVLWQTCHEAADVSEDVVIQ